MKQNSFSGLLWENTIKSWGAILTFLSFICAILTFYLTPDQSNIQLKAILPISVVVCFIIVISLRTAWSAFQNIEAQSPKVIFARSAPKSYQSSCALFLIEPNSQLSHDAIVSIYYLENDIEQLVGIGKVINVQKDKKVQIIVTDNYDFGDKLTQIMKNSRDELNRLIIKTSVPSFILEDILHGR